ncbi:hypothetical protein SM124_06485 [Bacillus sp. 31A1R]|uniref:Uncharacterized protein n=1 Tax=Robertmurraya mangrovi TaxID=3098077 RepID=A0ABU5IWA7_9BACI|nr:hypothetical protein [Bacillus sp. 31A1R]MDZ5471391.1 hypothetical protein [Bacillus sp. 31A1R]
MSTIMRMVHSCKNHHELTNQAYSKTTKLVLGSLLGALAAILQSAGLFAGVGYIFSTITTGPIILATIISIRIGILTYVLTTLLLVIIQPTEVLVFLFTTGLLGVGLGIAFKLLKKGILVTLMGGITLSLGIFALLYIFQFPILGPSVTSKVSGTVILGTLVLSILYSWIWMRLCMIGMRHLNRFIFRNARFEE